MKLSNLLTRFTRLTVGVGAVAAMVVGPASTAAAYPGAVPIDLVSYSIVELGVPPGTIKSTVSSIDSAGDVAGSVQLKNEQPHAFIWRNGTPLDLGSFPLATQATATNPSGVTVGWKTDLGDQKPRRYPTPPE
jgi:probable HAF family extracellular repeat protein